MTTSHFFSPRAEDVVARAAQLRHLRPGAAAVETRDLFAALIDDAGSGLIRLLELAGVKRSDDARHPITPSSTSDGEAASRFADGVLDVFEVAYHHAVGRASRVIDVQDLLA